MFAATAGSTVGAGVAPEASGSGACGDPVTSVAFAHGVALGAAVAAAADEAALEGAAGVVAGELQETAKSAAATKCCVRSR